MDRPRDRRSGKRESVGAVGYATPERAHSMLIRMARSDDREALVDIWLRSARATHRFLNEADIQSLLPAVRDVALVELEVWVLTADDKPIGFLGMSGEKMEALFLAPEFLRRGGGRLLVEHAQSQHPILLVDVNEQN